MGLRIAILFDISPYFFEVPRHVLFAAKMHFGTGFDDN